MKKAVLVLVVLFLSSCDKKSDDCECQYVISENGEQTFRSDFYQTDCAEIILTEKTYIDENGISIRVQSYLDCK